MDDVNEQTAWIIMGAMSAFGLLAFWVGWFAGRARMRAQRAQWWDLAGEWRIEESKVIEEEQEEDPFDKYVRRHGWPGGHLSG